jgi:hypothetical protein
MSGHSFTLVLTVAGAILSLWVVVRFPRIGPKSLYVALANVVVAYLVGIAAAGPLMDFLQRVHVPGSIALTVVGGALPPLVYLFTSAAWLIRSLQGLLAPGH